MSILINAALVLLIVLIVFLAVRRIVKNIRNKDCGCGCEGCGGCVKEKNSF